MIAGVSKLAQIHFNLILRYADSGQGLLLVDKPGQALDGGMEARFLGVALHGLDDWPDEWELVECALDCCLQNVAEPNAPFRFHCGRASSRGARTIKRLLRMAYQRFVAHDPPADRILDFVGNFEQRLVKKIGVQRLQGSPAADALNRMFLDEGNGLAVGFTQAGLVQGELHQLVGRGTIVLPFQGINPLSIGTLAQMLDGREVRNEVIDWFRHDSLRKKTIVS